MSGGGQEIEENPVRLNEVWKWLSEDLTRSSEELGRSGPVCPFLGRSLALGRLSVNIVPFQSDDAEEHFLEAVRSGISRLGHADENAYIYIPVSCSEQRALQAVTSVQSTLKPEAVLRGCMVGEFFPGHPMSGLHNPDFRPLHSPAPAVAVRHMVSADVMFLTAETIPAATRLEYLRIWHDNVGDSAARRWLQVAHDAAAAARRQISGQPASGTEDRPPSEAIGRRPVGG